MLVKPVSSEARSVPVAAVTGSATEYIFNIVLQFFTVSIIIYVEEVISLVCVSIISCNLDINAVVQGIAKVQCTVAV